MSGKKYPSWQINASISIIVIAIILWVYFSIQRHAQADRGSLTLLVSVVQACVFWWQLGVMRRAQIDTAYISEIEFRAYPEVLLLHEGKQAYISCSTFARTVKNLRFNSIIRNKNENHKIEHGRHINIEFFIRNSGRTTAYDLSLDYDIRLEDPDVTDETTDSPIIKFRYTSKESLGILPSTQVRPIKIQADQIISFTEEYDINHQYKGDLYMVCKLSFLDQFNKNRWFDFSYKFELSNGEVSSDWTLFHHMAASSDYPNAVVPNRPVKDIFVDWRDKTL